MTPVWWLNFHPEVDHGQMWDQTIVKWLLAPKPYADDYGENIDSLNGDGAIVVIPGRFHDTEADMDRINRKLHPLTWVVVIVTSDEESSFDVDRLTHPNRKVWVQTPKPGKHDPYGWLPVGWTPHTEYGHSMINQPKNLDWFFSGQITHSRRKELASVLHGLKNGVLNETEGFTQGLKPDAYIQRLASAKVAPCPSGPVTVDTFRLCEALQLGCIPIIETDTPHETQASYWLGMFGVHPLPTVESWYQLPTVLESLLSVWPSYMNEVGAWWIHWKRNLHRRFWDDVKAVRG